MLELTKNNLRPQSPFPFYLSTLFMHEIEKIDLLAIPPVPPSSAIRATHKK
jgi:hypothetical protein